MILLTTVMFSGSLHACSVSLKGSGTLLACYLIVFCLPQTASTMRFVYSPKVYGAWALQHGKHSISVACILAVLIDGCPFG